MRRVCTALSLFCFFFFQAEDGIRDLTVTGVQTCALPISWLVAPSLPTTILLTRLSLALAWGTVAGSVLQVAIQLPACWRVLHGIPVRWSHSAEGVRDVLVAWLPVVLGAGVAQISGLIDTLLGTLAGEGGASSLQYAQLLQVLPISLFGTSVAAVSLPDLSRDAQGSTPNEQLRARIAVGFRRIVFFILPSSLGFVALAPVIVRPLFQTGRFGAADTDLVGGVVAAYGVGLLGQACVKLFQSGFYALRDTKTPVKIASASLVLSSALAYLLMRRFGPAGIALGSSLGATVNVVFHLRDLDARVGAILGGTEWRAFAVSLLVSGAAAAAGLETARIAAGWGAFAAALFALVIFGAVYFGGTIALRHPDARRLWTFLR